MEWADANLKEGVGESAVEKRRGIDRDSWETGLTCSVLCCSLFLFQRNILLHCLIVISFVICFVSLALELLEEQDHLQEPLQLLKQLQEVEER